MVTSTPTIFIIRPDGVIDREPPGLGEPFPVLVPQVDSLGNEVGGVRSVELEAPLASYLPWNLRKGQPGDTTELTRILGTYLASIHQAIRNRQKPSHLLLRSLQPLPTKHPGADSR